MEMKNDCPETFSTESILPKPITGLNIWPPSDPNVTTRDIYSASNRGIRRGNFAINPEWTSENRNEPPKTVRAIGRVYEPSPVDFFGARDLHAKTWEQARIYPGHGVNPHHAVPGYAPYLHVPVDYRTAKDDISNSWPWNQQQPLLDWKNQRASRPKTAIGTYYSDGPETSRFDEELNQLHDIHVKDKMESGKPDIETREFTRSNREILYGYQRKLEGSSPTYISDHLSKLPHPYAVGGHRELTDLFAQTYSRNLPQMLFRRAQHAHAPWHAYMSFCDWGEPRMQSEQAVAA